MTMTFQAVYEGGVLRPMQALALREGEAVDVTITKKNAPGRALRPPTPEEEDYARRMKAARSLEEMFKIMETAPPSPLPDGYDLCQALNANRRASGERILFPEAEDRSNP